jgi:hypothetical protein
MNDTEVKRLNTLVRQKSKPELARMCQEKNLPTKGTKHDLAIRLLGLSFSVEVQKCTDQSRDDLPTLLIEKNKYGQYVHNATRLVFNKATRKVIGSLESENKVKTLTRSDISLCRQYKFQYQLPERLDMPPEPLRAVERDEHDGFDDDDASDDENMDENIPLEF